MEKSKLKTFTKILAIIIICLISFGGIYVQKLNMMENVVKDYKLGDDLKGYREVYLEVGSDVSDEVKTVENFENAKAIIEKRLEGLGVENYNLSLDKKTGKMYLQLSENEYTDNVIANIKETGKIEFKDSEDGTVLLDNSKVKNVRRVYNTTEDGTVVFIEIQFNKEGTEIYKDMTGNTYAKIDTNTAEENTTSEEGDTTANEEESDVTSESETTENTETEEVTQKQVTLSISGQDITTTSFENVIENGIVDLSMNNATTDSKQLNNYARSAGVMTVILNNGPLPMEYSISGNQYVKSDIQMKDVIYVLAVIAGIIVILLIYMIIKNKTRGLLAAIGFAGFVALYWLLLRYTNVVISIESIVGIIIALLLNYWFNMKLLSIKSEDISMYNREYRGQIIKVIPILAISIIFSFTGWYTINTFGMTLMWGIVLAIIYNRLITKNIID